MEMKTEHIKDYLWSEMIPDVNNDDLVRDCLFIEEYLKFKLPITSPGLKNDQWVINYGSFTGRNYLLYNLLTFPSNELIKLYGAMVKSITPSLDPNTNYTIQCWLNIYRENGFIDWHSHWPKEAKAYHGFYCVNTEDCPSFTDYKFPCLNEDITTVYSKNSLLVYGKSENDLHKSSGGWNSERPRVTIAFDIIPIPFHHSEHTDFFNTWIINHFIPFK